MRAAPRPANTDMAEVAELFSRPELVAEMQGRLKLGLREWEEGVIARYFPPSGRVLDVGCGPGREAILLAQRGYDVVGADLSGAELAQARTNAREAGVTVEWALTDGLHVPPGPFAVAIIWVQVLGNMHRYADQLALLQSCREALQPGGLLSVSGHNREFCYDRWRGQMKDDWFYPWGYEGFRYATFTFETLERPVREAGFDIIHTEVPDSLRAIMHTIAKKPGAAS